MNRTKRVAACMTFVSVAGFASTMPYVQSRRDSLGCDALCVGALTSVRSALALVGAPLVGRVADAAGRKTAIVLAACGSLSSAILTARASSVRGLWLALGPAALLSHEYDALKAVLADAYNDEPDPSQLAGAQGSLGMAAGLGFLGVACGGYFSTPARVMLVALVAALVSTAGAALLPATKKQAAEDVSASVNGGLAATVRGFLALPSARSPQGLTLLSLRLIMGLAFHVFMSIWQTSLKQRFPNFATSDNARFMTFIGLGYAFSQGFVARPTIAFAEKRGGTRLLLIACCAALSCGRCCAVAARELWQVYACYAPVICALGIVNASVTAAVSRAAPAAERGTFFGVLSAVESTCGIFGPVLGGLLSLRGYATVCATVVALYAAAALIIAHHWHLVDTPTQADPAKEELTAQSEKKQR